MTNSMSPEEIAEMSEDCQCSCKELEQLRADISQAYDLRDKAEGRYCTALGAIEQLHAAVKTAQELAARRLMEIDRLKKREKDLMDVIDSRDRALGFVPLDEVHASRTGEAIVTNEQLIAIEMKPLEGCAAVLVSFNRPFTHVEMNAMHRALNEHLIPHDNEPLPCADPGWEIREGKATCKGCGKTAEQVFGASRDAPSESQKMMAAGYASRRIPREDFSKGASRDADHCDYPDCEQHWTHVVAQARALLEPLAEHDPAIRQWLKTPDLPSLGASRDASSEEAVDRLARERFNEVHRINPRDQWELQSEAIKDDYRNWVMKRIPDKPTQSRT